MTIYNIHHTNKNKPTINVDETEIDTTSTDLKFFGRRRLQYGQELNQNIMFILEHFACPEISSSPVLPDTSTAVNPANSNTDFTPLQNPTDGQMWFNSTQQRLFVWDGITLKWLAVGLQDDVAANWGIIYHGQQLPRPVSQRTGYVFPYSECSWIVSPYQFPQQNDYMLCDTDAEATVSSLYSNVEDVAILKGFATYMIVGIKGNLNLGTLQPIPSNTPTPAITPTPSTTPAATPAVTPTSTPVATPSYSGTLNAFFAARFPYDPPFYAGPGTVQPYYAGDFHRIKYPGISTTKYKILYSTAAPPELQTTPAAPHNPWDNVAGNYYVYIKNTADAGPLGTFASLSALYHTTIFCTGKSTEPSTAMVEGVDGLFFRVSNITNLGAYIQLQLQVVELPPVGVDINLYGHPPLQTSPIDMLKFNYDYVYATGAFFFSNPSLVNGQTAPASCSGVSSTDTNAKFYLCPPTPYAGSFDLYIQGGHPPYTITDIKYYGPHGNGTGVNSKAPSVVASGFTPTGNQNLPEPVSFTQLTTATATKPFYVGAINFPSGNPNIQQISNGYVVRNYVTCDLNYSTDFATKYGTSCQPEWLWHWNYKTPTGTQIEGASCATTTGNSTTYCADSFAIVITDADGTTLTVPLGYGGDFQTIDTDVLGQTYGFAPVVSGPSPGTPISVAGTYTYDLNYSFASLPTSLRPISSPAQLQYVFSLLDSTTNNVSPTGSGQYKYTIAPGHTLLARPTNLNCVNATSNNSLIHIGCDISNPDSSLQCPSSGGYLGAGGYSFGPLTPNVSQQSITITEVWRNNGTPGVVNISGTPIVVNFKVKSSTNTFTWNNLTLDRQNNHTGSFTSPRVPYGMKIEVVLPAGLNFVGTLFIPFAAFAYDNPNGGCAFGTAGGSTFGITLNFANTHA